jgi:glyceraldehyde 3-phosphate dehydrogenase
MSIKVGINGFGRMGRLALRESWGCADFEIVHINEMAGNVQSAAHLLRFDSVHGQWDKDVSIKDDALVIDGQPIGYSQNEAIADTHWQQANVDLILDCTGAFKSPEALQPYFDQDCHQSSSFLHLLKAFLAIRYSTLLWV